MATCTATPPPTSKSCQKTNHTRLCRLLTDIGTKVLRGIHDSQHPPAVLQNHLNSPAVKNTLKSLKTKRILNLNQWDKLYPASGVASSNTFDITLLFLLLRNTCDLTPPTTGWDAAPLPEDVSKEADLIRVKRCRNEVIGHSTVAELSDADFETRWAEIEAALIRLGGSLYEPEIQRLKIESLVQSLVEGDDKKIDAILEKLNQPSQDSEHLVPFCNLPQKPSHVTIGRTSEVSKIMAEIQRLQLTYSNEVTVTYLSGNPGCGKSELSRQIGKKYFDETEESIKCVITLNASNLEILSQSYMDLAYQLQCNELSITSIMNTNNSQEQKLTQMKGLVKPKLLKYSSWLMIADNVEELQLVLKYLPHPGQKLHSGGKGHILITTQDSQSIPLSDPYSFQMSLSHGMDPIEAVRSLRDISGYFDEGEIVHFVAKELDFQPLALASAAVYMHHVRISDPTMTWEIYLQTIKNGNRESADKRYEKTNKAAYEKSMTTAVSMAVKKLTEESKVMLHACEFLAALAPEFVSLVHVVNYVMKCMPDEDAKSIEVEIINSSLILTSRDKHERRVELRVHQVVFSVFQSIVERLYVTEEEELSYLTKVMEVFSYIEGNHEESMEYIISTGRLVSHFIKLSKKIETFFKRNEVLLLTEKDEYGVRYSFINRRTASEYLPLANLMFFVLSRVLKRHGKYEISRILLEFCIALERAQMSSAEQSGIILPDVDNVQLASMLFDFAYILDKFGEYCEAKMCYDHAFNINTRKFGNNSAIVAANFGGLGRVLRNLSRFPEAMDCYEKCLGIQKRIYGNNHISVAATLNNQGLVLRDIGRYKESKDCYTKALDIFVATLGDKHPDVGVALGNLGTVLRGLGEYADSKECCEKALNIHKMVYEESHPTIGVHLYFLGLSLHGLGEYQQSKLFFERSLATLQAAYGEDHPQVAKTLNALGQLQLEQGDNEQAKVNLDRALMINETHFSQNHSQLAVTLNNLGRLSENVHEYEQARRYFERALAINEKTFNENHYEIAITLNNLGNLLVKLKKDKEGRLCVERALVIKEKNPDYAFKF